MASSCTRSGRWIITPTIVFMLSALAFGGMATLDAYSATMADTPPPTTTASSQPTVVPDKEAEPATSTVAEKTDEETKPVTSAVAKKTDEEAKPVTSAEAEKSDKEKPLTPSVEVYVPSTMAMAKAIKKSDTAELGEAIARMFPRLEKKTDGELDIGSLLVLLNEIRAWPDTSIVMTTYTEDRDGKPRWAIRLDWPLDDLAKRLDSLLKHDAARQLFEDVSLEPLEEGGHKLTLPDLTLAVLASSGEGSLIASSGEIEPPATVFGQEIPVSKKTDDQANPKKKPKKSKKSLIYCRLNIGADNEADNDSPFASFSVINNVLYGASLRKNGQWSEKFSIGWNPFLGLALKSAFKKTSKPFSCPRESYAAAAFNLKLGQNMADSVAGLDAGTIGGRASSETACSVVPGMGFIPCPDVFFQFRARNPDKIVEAIRKFIKDDIKDREGDGTSPDWFEEKIGGRTVFWHDPAINKASVMLPVTYRTAVFFKESDEENQAREDSEDSEVSDRATLIVAMTSMWADDAVRNWDRLMRAPETRVSIPNSKKAHWQARINWLRLYELAMPYLTVVAGFSGGAGLPPQVEELAESLADSTINVRVEYVGLKVRHTGPIPIGMFYVPGVVATSLSSTPSYSSESAREHTACKHLRVLHHHAKLFKKDYKRWPATVAELDGYVDFSSHAYLLKLRSKDHSFTRGFVSFFTSSDDVFAGTDDESDEDAVDDSLYEIEWSPTNWKLKIRDGEFKKLGTIYIDTKGEIHRTPKTVAEEGEKEKSPKL